MFPRIKKTTKQRKGQNPLETATPAKHQRTTVQDETEPLVWSSNSRPLDDAHNEHDDEYA
jgi:hypothetical protein